METVALNSQYNSHYGRSMKPEDMRKWAEQTGKHLDKLFFNDNGKFNKFFPVLVYQGMSGISAATALSLFCRTTPPGMVYVRKEHEDSHGSEVEVANMGHLNEEKPVMFIFCDDFVDGGSTMRRVMMKVQQRFEVQLDVRKHVKLAFSSRENCIMDLDDDLSDRTQDYVQAGLDEEWPAIAARLEQRRLDREEAQRRMEEQERQWEEDNRKRREEYEAQRALDEAADVDEDEEKLKPSLDGWGIFKITRQETRRCLPGVFTNL